MISHGSRGPNRTVSITVPALPALQSVSSATLHPACPWSYVSPSHQHVLPHLVEQPHHVGGAGPEGAKRAAAQQQVVGQELGLMRAGHLQAGSGRGTSTHSMQGRYAAS
jgi:hypothetical protein